MLKVESIRYDDLTKEEQFDASNNGSGKEYASYIKVTYNDKVICLASDAMEPEDAGFHRDLSWVKVIINKAYDLGRQERKTS